MHRINILVWTLLGIGLCSACSHTLSRPESILLSDTEESESHQAPLAKLESSEVTQGGVAVIHLRSKDVKPEDLHVFWNDREIPHFSPNDKSSTRMAILGIPMSTKPGPSRIEVRTQVDKYLVTESLDLLIKEREVTPERIQVKRKFTPRRGKRFISLRQFQTKPNLPSQTPGSSEPPLWNEGFALPVAGHVTSEFGSCRVFNGRLQTMHNGTDFQAKTGDPVRSAAGGRVVLAKRLFLTGKTIIIDHGLGIITTYAHLSKLLVKKGALVGDQTLIGLAGSTGRASGSHLHLSAKINGVKVDPLELIQAFGNKGASKTASAPEVDNI